MEIPGTEKGWESQSQGLPLLQHLVGMEEGGGKRRGTGTGLDANFGLSFSSVSGEHIMDIMRDTGRQTDGKTTQTCTRMIYYIVNILHTIKIYNKL